MPARDTTLSRIRLRHLQCFLAVAQAGTLRGAAQALSITQPAVTKTLNELEALLGTPLFVRGRAGATLTAAAEVFRLHAAASVQALGQAIDSVARGAGEAPLSVGVLPTLAPSFMPPVLRAFAAARPGVTLRIHTDRNKDLVEMLRAGELDVVIGRLSDPDAMVGVNFEHLYAQPLMIVLRHGHPFAARRRRGTALSALASLPLVLPPPGTMIRQLADGFLARCGIAAPAGVVETLDTALARAMVLEADHAWLTPLDAVRRDLADGLMLRLEADIAPEESVGLMLATDRLPSASLQALLGAVRQQARQQRRPVATPRAPFRRR
ncbi:MAG TPA: LysR substrate-binding domain-containing protein [Albitalea sp.]|nr:LysR substrate-binding domain-containing protein [Albitalea sp.]